MNVSAVTDTTISCNNGGLKGKFKSSLVAVVELPFCNHRLYWGLIPV